MYTETQLGQIKNAVSNGIQNALGDRLHKIILYGSYARGDYNDDSDIDIMVLADINDSDICKYRAVMNDVANRVGLKYDAFVTISIKSRQMFYDRLEILPFYQNVIKDGVELYGN
jgi:predicted nucleotidyltransferase